MKNFDLEIRDDEIRIIGFNEGGGKKPKRSRTILWTIAAIAIAAVGLIIFSISGNDAIDNEPAENPTNSEPAGNAFEKKDSIAIPAIGTPTAYEGYCEIKDTSINDVPLRIYIPHNAEMTLQIGQVEKNDTCIIFVAQAADVRADNGDIVGAFVLKGEPLSRGLSKKGYCASINGRITIGVAENSPLYEEAVEKGGYFFRQYPLVSNGVMVENEPKGKSIRRGICDRNGEIFIVESLSIESFHDFAQALADMQVSNAVYIVGSSAYGWADDKDGAFHEFGIPTPRGVPQKTSYMVWRKTNCAK
jgi:hypothetical protein